MNREWSELNKSVQTLLKKRDTYEEGLEKLFELRGKLWDVICSFRSELSREDLCAMPFIGADGYHSKTIAYSLWHIFRIEDITAHTLIAGDEQVFFRGGYQERTGSPIITTGNELSGRQIADFSEQLEAVMANAVYSENLGFRLDPFSDDYPLRKEKGNPSLFSDSSGTWNLNWLPYLGMGTGKTIRQSLGEGRSVAVGQDIHVGRLLDVSLTKEELESLFGQFVRTRAGLPKPVLTEYQRQLDDWRAGR